MCRPRRLPAQISGPGVLGNSGMCVDGEQISEKREGRKDAYTTCRTNLPPSKAPWFPNLQLLPAPTLLLIEIAVDSHHIFLLQVFKPTEFICSVDGRIDQTFEMTDFETSRSAELLTVAHSESCLE